MFTCRQFRVGLPKINFFGLNLYFPVFILALQKISNLLIAYAFCCDSLLFPLLFQKFQDGGSNDECKFMLLCLNITKIQIKGFTPPPPNCTTVGYELACTSNGYTVKRVLQFLKWKCRSMTSGEKSMNSLC